MPCSYVRSYIFFVIGRQVVLAELLKRTVSAQAFCGMHEALTAQTNMRASKHEHMADVELSSHALAQMADRSIHQPLTLLATQTAPAGPAAKHEELRNLYGLHHLERQQQLQR